MNPNDNITNMPRSLLWMILVVILLIIGLGLFWISIKQSLNLPFFQQQTSSSPTRQTENILDREVEILNVIKRTFTSSDYKNVVRLANLAASEKDNVKKYQLYKNTFQAMTKAYAETNDMRYKYAMIDLKSYLSIYPQYNEKELIIPQ